MREPNWRCLRPTDLGAVESIAARVHPGFYEGPEIFSERLALFPAGAWLLACKDQPMGYVIAHPWMAGAIPALNTRLEALPQHPDTLYLHDLALLPDARGVGAASRILPLLCEVGAGVGLPTMSLVAVNGSRPFWERFGFAAVDRPDLAPKLRSYEAAAVFMVRPLA